jgi:hypothetical protein
MSAMVSAFICESPAGSGFTLAVLKCDEKWLTGIFNWFRSDTSGSASDFLINVPLRESGQDMKG